ncbi:hypothetical protein Bco22_011860 [Bartonella sp. Coyote22sub2]|nr:hypothetical protein Bho11B_000310 [Bartonella sp. 11B]AQX24657.1 hypothetical protein Bho114_013500 [Bartonella sp. 114]AQX25833.1 hypothetical protein Bco22_011860 [Bartonella sp. Coyote22sub2]
MKSEVSCEKDILLHIRLLNGIRIQTNEILSRNSAIALRISFIIKFIEGGSLFMMLKNKGVSIFGKMDFKRRHILLNPQQMCVYLRFCVVFRQ